MQAMWEVQAIVADTNTRRVETESEQVTWITGWTFDFLREEQLKDSAISRILKMKEASEDRPKWSEISQEGQSVPVPLECSTNYGKMRSLGRVCGSFFCPAP